MDWLLAQVGAAATHSISSGIASHGYLMALAWAVLMPAGFVISRFYKITPGQDWPRRGNPFWFNNHRRLGYAIGIVTAIALACILWDDGTLILWQSYHAITGWALLALASFQIVGSLFRGTHGGPFDPVTRQAVPPELWPGDHYSLTQRRIFFEYSHKIVGYILVPLTVWQIVSGLQDAGAPRWSWVAIGLWTLIVFAVFARLQLAGRCIDTYQAIWGFDDTLPGYRRKPIGWGITRLRRP